VIKGENLSNLHAFGFPRNFHVIDQIMTSMYKWRYLKVIYAMKSVTDHVNMHENYNYTKSANYVTACYYLEEPDI
jgi:hypothetical protein